ncbi:hypothetical protein [Microbacterium thalli]|uniref:DUF5666 domain-containing protein n=1 Tax=Microbacterium thalli TaxID=3027921 RepID=A0ABT5SMQ0_9MICO|nr:hypothetical protein [Microbacterium thalli]MDD7963302.1 hypothetical protein [Microbacterium thalli]
MYSPLDAAGIITLPVGVEPGSDLGAMTTGRLLGVDPASRIVQVSVLGSDPVWVPAVPAIYRQGGAVRLLRSPLDGGRLTACLGPLDEVLPVARGEVVSIDAAARRMQVSLLGEVHTLRYNPSTYTVGQFVHVQRDPASFGRPYFVSGPDGEAGVIAPPGPGTGQENAGQVETKTVTIGAQWSGSWTGSRWDNWNQYRSDYGGRAALYQGQGYGSPNMLGLAVYGDQIANLQARRILNMTARLERPANGSGGGGGPAVLQGSPHGGPAPGGGPAATGATASVVIQRGTVAEVALPQEMFEPFRTGALRGLALVGSTYLNLFGSDRAGAMTLTIQYEVVR